MNRLPSSDPFATPEPSDRTRVNDAPIPGAYDQLGVRLARSVGRRVDTLAPTSTVRPVAFSALRRKAERVRHTRRIAIAAVTGAVTVTGAVALGTGAFENEAVVGTVTPPTPEEQAAELVGRHAPTFVPDDLTLQTVTYQGSGSIEPVADSWVQVFAPETADLAHPGLLVSTVAPPPTFDSFEYGEEHTVGGHPARLITQPDGALALTVLRPDASITFDTIDLTRDQLLAVAASAVIEPGGRGVTLTGLPPAWSPVLSQAATWGPYVGLSYYADDVNRQLTLNLELSPGYVDFRLDQGGEPVTLSDGTGALLFRSSDGGVALYWVAGTGVGITLTGYQLSEDEVVSVADSVRSFSESDWNTLVASSESIENYLRDDPNADAQQTATTVAAAATPSSTPGSGPNWQDAGIDLDELPVGSWRTAGENSGPWLVARIDDDTVVGVFNHDGNLAGTCYILPVGTSDPISFGGAVTPGSIADPDHPEAAAFVNDCTGATYALNGTVISGSAVGLATFPVRITANDRIEYAPDNEQAGRPAA